MFDPQVYRSACEELRMPQDKVEEMIEMMEQKGKKARRPFRTMLIAAAAVAMMVVGVGAANPEVMQELFVHIASAVRIDEFRQEMVTTEGESITVLSVPKLDVENRDGRAFLLVDEEEIDITQSLEKEHQYVYEKTTPQDTKLSVVVTGTVDQWTMTVEMEEEGKKALSFTTQSQGDWLTPGVAVDNPDVKTGMDVSQGDSQGEGEICVSEYHNGTAAVVPSMG